MASRTTSKTQRSGLRRQSDTIRSRFPDDPCTVAQAIIDCNNRGRAFIFQSGEDSNSIIEGLTIVNGMASGPIATGTQIVPNPEDANIYQRDGIDASGDGYGGAIYVGKNTSRQSANAYLQPVW
jgi:hypothetical protein